jgi:hypothetical protein
VADVELLQRELSAVPIRHHLETCISENPQQPAVPLATTDGDKVKQASEYAKEFAKSFQKAQTRLGEASRLKPLHERTTQVHAQAVECTSPWIRAQIDVYEMLVKAAAPDPSLYEMFHPVADVGQSAYRGAIHVQGTLPSISTSTKLWSYNLNKLAP